jgi:hypothetical protein
MSHRAYIVVCNGNGGDFVENNSDRSIPATPDPIWLARRMSEIEHFVASSEHHQLDRAGQLLRASFERRARVVVAGSRLTAVAGRGAPRQGAVQPPLLGLIAEV